MAMTQHTPYSIARFDGALMFHTIRAGLMKTGITKSPIVFFKVRAGAQMHPVWALDDLAVEIYAYGETAKAAGVSETHLQVAVTASWVSGENYSNLFATFVEWHIASSELRKQARQTSAELLHRKGRGWPGDELTIPVAVVGR